MEEIHNVLVDELKKRLDPVVIYLYGSAAKGTMQPRSDVDVAVLLNRKLTGAELFDIAGALGVRLNRDVDLVDFGIAPPALKVQIISGGKVLYCRDEGMRQEREMLALSEYQRLNEERKETVKARYGGEAWM